MFISPRHFCSQLFIKITETMDVKKKIIKKKVLTESYMKTCIISQAKIHFL